MHQKKQPNNTTTTMQTIPMQKLEKMHEKNKQPNRKMGKRAKETFLQRKYTDGQ